MAPLLERDDVLAGLGGDSPAVVEAGAGAGKSALLDALAAAVDGTMPVLRAAGEPAAREHEHGALAEALGMPATTSVHDLSAALRDRRGLLLVDDLQWADDASLLVLARTAERGGPEGLRVLGATRPMPPGERPALDRVLAAARHVALAPLSAGAVGALLGGCGARARTEAVRLTRGNPFLVAALAAAVGEGALDLRAPDAKPLPRSVARRIVAGLARSGADALALAEALAALGRDGTVARAARVAGLDRATAAAIAERLAGWGVLSDEGCAVAQPLMASALLDHAGVQRRGQRRAAAARVLDADGVSAERVAALLLEAPPAGDARAAAVLRRAARCVAGAGAAQEAVRLLERALDEPPPPEDRLAARLELAAARITTNDPSEDDYAAALELAVTDADRVGVLGALARARVAQGRFAAAVEAAEAAHAALAPGADRRLVREALATAAYARAFTTPDALDHHVVEQIGVDEAPVPEERRLLGHVAISGVVTGRIDLTGASELAARAIDDGRLLRDAGVDASVLSMVTAVLYHAGEFARSVDLTTAALASVRSHASGEVAIVRYLRTAPLLALGRLAEAEADASAALTAMDPASPWSTGPEWVLALVRMEQGRSDEGLRVLARPHPITEVVGIVGHTRLAARARLLLALGRTEDALAAARAAGALEPPGTFSQGMTVSQWRALAAQALIALGRDEEALESAADELAASERWGAPHAAVGPLIAIGLATGPAGAASLDRAVERAAASEHVLLTVEALLHRGAATRRDGRPAQARGDLYAARDLADRHDLPRLAAWAREELGAAGARPRGGPRDGVDSLTASERRVAERAAAGARNRAIAGELYLSTKTVEFHLSNVYRKLGVRSREELRDRLDATPPS